MTDARISELAAASATDGNELAEIVQGGVNKKLAISNFGSAYRGDWDPTGDVLPSSNVLRGQRWRLTSDYKGFIGTIEAATNAPSSDADWNFYPTTTF